MAKPKIRQWRTWGHRPLFLARWCIAIFMVAVWNAAPVAPRAQVPLPSVETEAIYQRLERQEAEIERLREQIARSLPPVQPAPVAPGPPAVLPVWGERDPIARPPVEFTSAAANEKQSAPNRAQTGEKSGAKPAAEKKPDEGWMDLSREKWTVKLGGHVQGDYVNWVNADPAIPAQDYFEFRRLRLLADGTGYGVYEFRIQIDIEPESELEGGVTGPFAAIKDAYLGMQGVPGLGKVRFGNFFVPFSLEQVTNDTNNIFFERSIPTAGIFTPDREVGVAAYNTNEAQNVTWSFGAFFDSISEALKERIDDNQGYRLSGRATWLPYYDEPSQGRYLVHTGAGIVYTDDQDDRVRFRARPQIHEGPRLIDSGILFANTYTVANLELATVWGPLSVQTEWFLTNVNLFGEDPVNFSGAYLYASYFLTGENRKYERFGQHGAQFGRTTPFSNFFLVPGGCGPGAWEVKARWSYLDLNEVDRGRYNDLTLGFNWYWTDRIRMMFEWIHPVTSSETVFGATESDLLATRLDFNF